MNPRLQAMFRVDDNYQLSSWLFLRGVALIYFIAFLSLAVQISGLAGPNGILPFHLSLEYAYQESGWLAWLEIPTVFWIDASDTALQVAAYGGAALAVLLFFGRWQTGALIGMFVLYVSLFHAGDLFLSFQWDTLLLETGFLAIFLALGGDSIKTYEKKVQCCGGALACSEPEKSQEMIKGIIEAAYDNDADMIATPCPLCQANVEIYQDQINAKYGTKFDMPVVYYSQLISVAYGRNANDAALNGQVIKAKKLEEIAAK